MCRFVDGDLRKNNLIVNIVVKSILNTNWIEAIQSIVYIYPTPPPRAGCNTRSIFYNIF